MPNLKRHCFTRKQRKIREQSEREAYQNQWVIVVDGHMHINRHRGCVTEGEECRPADPETMILALGFQRVVYVVDDGSGSDQVRTTSQISTTKGFDSSLTNLTR